MCGESEDYWKGYDDHRARVYSTDRYLNNSKEKDDYIRGQDDSEDDKQNGYDAR